jgi:hypothetical protein
MKATLVRKSRGAFKSRQPTAEQQDSVLRKMKSADQNCLRFWVYEKGPSRFDEQCLNPFIRRTEMTAQELYKAIGVGGYETLACWRKEGVCHFRLSPPAS